jgi:hypothetical protein
MILLCHFTSPKINRKAESSVVMTVGVQEKTPNPIVTGHMYDPFPFFLLSASVSLTPLIHHTNHLMPVESSHPQQ